MKQEKVALLSFPPPPPPYKFTFHIWKLLIFKWVRRWRRHLPGPVFTNHSFEHSLFCYPGFSKSSNIWMLHNFWLAKPYGLASQQLCYIHIHTIMEEKDKDCSKNGWWIRSQVGLRQYLDISSENSWAINLCRKSRHWTFLKMLWANITLLINILAIAFLTPSLPNK